MYRDELFSAVTYTHVTSEQRAVTMGCLFLESKGWPCLLDIVGEGLIKNRQIDLLDRVIRKGARKKMTVFVFPYGDVIFQQITSNKGWKLFGQTIGFPLVFIPGNYFFSFWDPQKIWVSTLNSSNSQLKSLELFYKIQCWRVFYKKLKNISCEYDRLNGWDSTFQAAR